MGNPFQSYEVSPAIRDYTVSPAIWYKWTRPALGCVYIDTSSGFRLLPVEASLVRMERSRSLVQAHNSTHVGHIENSQWNRIEEMLRH